MGWYKTGTVAVSNGSKHVAGTSTVWVDAIFPGDTFTADNDHFYEIDTVLDNTHFDLIENFAESTIAGASYKILPTSPSRNSLTTLVKQFGDLLADYQTVVQIRASDKLIYLNREADDGQAGIIMQSEGVYKKRMGTFGDDVFRIQKSDTGDNSSWSDILTVTDDGLLIVEGYVTFDGVETLENKTIVSPIITGHATIEGAVLTGATGTGKLVLDAGATITGATLTTATIDASANTITNITTAMLAAAAFSTDGTLASNSDTIISSQKALKTYIDNAVTGLSWKAAVQVATTTNITLSGVQTLNGVTGSAGVTRVAVLGQSAPADNGIYVMQSGAWTRALDANSASEIWGMAFYVEAGDNTNGGKQYVNSNATLPTLGSTSLTFSQIAGAGTYTNGQGITLTGNAFSIANAGITYALIQNVTAARLLGNPTGGAAAPSEISLGATLAFSGSALQTTAHTGDVTSAANSNALTVAVIGGVTVGGATGTGSVVFSAAPAIVGGSHVAITTLGLRSTGASFDLRLASSEVLTANRQINFVTGNADRAVTLGGDFVTVGSYTLALTVVGSTNVTLPTTGVLATLTGAETFQNKSIDASANTLTNIATTMFAANVFDTDAALAANSATRIASQSAIKSYIDAAVQGLSWKTPVATVATANVALTGEQTIHGYLTSASRVLLTAQTDPKENGIWITAAGAWTRSTDANTSNEIMWATTIVEFGTEVGSVYTNNNSTPPVIGTDNITFVLAGVSTGSVIAGTGLSSVGTTLSIAANGVTYALFQTMAANTLHGNPTGSTATSQAITLGSTLTFSGTALQTTAHTGDVTSSGNSFAMTVAKIQSVTVAGVTGTNNVVFSSMPTINDPTIPGSTFIGGLTLSTAGSSTTFSVATGAATDLSSGSMMCLASAISKTTGAWTVGSTNGALDTGSVAADTWYSVYLIKRVDTGVVDVLISTNHAGSPTMPTNYTLKRRIGGIRTNSSSQWWKFTQVGDEFVWDAPFKDVETFINVGSTTATLTVPPGASMVAHIRGFITSLPAGCALLITSLYEAAPTVNTPRGNFTARTATTQAAVYAVDVVTDTSKQIRLTVDNNSSDVTVNVWGWRDSRGR